MLLKLNAIEEIGRFAMLRHQAEQFSRLSLVFARNGYGKSTLCAILRSASEERPSYIQARRRLDAKKESRVQSKWASGATVAFGGGKWNSCPGKVYVFDQEFIHQNLHVGESVTRENKRSLLPVVLGEGGVELARKIVALDREQRDLDASMKNNAAVIRARCPILTLPDLLAFCTRAIPSDISNQIESSKRALELAKQSAAVKQKKNPKSFPLEPIGYYREILERTVSSISEDASQQVQIHIDAHKLSPRGHQWLEFGVDHLKGDRCPFCDQPISGLDLIGAYQTYFSEAFAKLISDRDAAIAAVAEVEADTGFSSLADENAADFLFWQQVAELPDPPALSTNERATIKTGLRALSKLFEQKVANPLKPIALSDSGAQIQGAFALIAHYNSGIAKSVTAIEKARRDVPTVDVSQSQNMHARLVALSERDKEPIKSEAAAYASADARRKAIEIEKKTAQDALSNYAKKTMSNRQTAINNLLIDFGTDFKIVDAKANFVGREPNTDYAIAIGAKKVKVGEKSESEPSFSTVLSAGDKTTLALAIFITQIRDDPKLGDAVVVFDDPFNSQDMNRQFETSSQVRAIASLACQTIVFSHDPRFLRMIEKDADNAMTRTFQIVCTDSGEGSISGWSATDELKDLYIRQSEMIREYANQGTLLKDVTQVSVLQAIRPFLEDYIRARFPGRFSESDMLKGMNDAIRAAGGTDPLFESANDLDALNEFTRPNMHGGGTAPDPTALRAQCKRIVRIIGRY
jgi:wobble nucleotide-excising tRNase